MLLLFIFQQMDYFFCASFKAPCESKISCERHFFSGNFFPHFVVSLQEFICKKHNQKSIIILVYILSCEDIAMQRVLLLNKTWQRVREFQSKKFSQYADNRNCFYDIINFLTHFFTTAMLPEKSVVGGNFSNCYIIGNHSNNVLIWFTKWILGTVFLCPYNVCPK